ncbi:MAG: T9SS type A sorting domain-containing protein, partial [Bacteroidota bacterium]
QDYIVQYRIALNGTWTDVPGAVIVTANNWTSGVVDSVALPDTCSNQPSLFLRWLMTTNTNTTGGAVTSAGIDKIDDIYITGKQLSTGLTEEQAAVVCRIYPNPAREKLFIESYVAISEIALINPQGTAGLIMPGRGGDSLEVNLSTLLPGIYFVKVQLQSGKSIIRKILLY